MRASNIIADWMEIPSNTIVCITPNINVLTYPIMDEYHIDSPEQHPRNPDFAVRAGFHPSVPLNDAAIATAAAASAAAAASTRLVCQ